MVVIRPDKEVFEIVNAVCQLIYSGMSETYALTVIHISEKPFPHLTAFKNGGPCVSDGNGSSKTK